MSSRKPTDAGADAPAIPEPEEPATLTVEQAVAAAVPPFAETEWIDLAERYGDRCRHPDGRPWKILLRTDLSHMEWLTFQRKRGDDVLPAAAKIVIAHDGWLDAEGELIPQPHETAEDVLETLRFEPVDPNDPETLYRRVVQEVKTTIHPFWLRAPVKFTENLGRLAWELSTTLPLPKTLSLGSSPPPSVPTANGRH